jgi:hypothetical protein
LNWADVSIDLRLQVTEWSEAILEVFGFVEMNRLLQGRKQYVHVSGGMFAMFDVERCSFLWSWNHMLGVKYRSARLVDPLSQ